MLAPDGACITAHNSNQVGFCAIDALQLGAGEAVCGISKSHQLPMPRSSNPDSVATSWTVGLARCCCMLRDT